MKKRVILLLIILISLLNCSSIIIIEKANFDVELIGQKEIKSYCYSLKNDYILIVFEDFNKKKYGFTFGLINNEFSFDSLRDFKFIDNFKKAKINKSALLLPAHRLALYKTEIKKYDNTIEILVKDRSVNEFDLEGNILYYDEDLLVINKTIKLIKIE